MLAAPKRSWRHAGLVGALLITSCVDSTAPALPHAPASIEISGSGSLVIYMGFQVALTAVVKDGLGSTVSHGVMWSSSNPGVAAVTSSGVVYGVSIGSAEISARVDGFSAVVASTQITVIPIPVASVHISPDYGTIYLNNTVQLTATTKDASGNTLTGRAVTWSSSNSLVASVSASGLVRGVSAGSATITATSEGKSGTASFTVRTRTVDVSFTIGSSSNALQEFNINLSALGISGAPASVTVTRVDFRGDFEHYLEYVDVYQPRSNGLTRGSSYTRVGQTDDRGDTSSWTESTTLALYSNVSWATYVSGGSLFMRVWVDPSLEVNWRAAAWGNWWDLRFYVTG